MLDTICKLEKRLLLVYSNNTTTDAAVLRYRVVTKYFSLFMFCYKIYR
ncbi:MAG: hypothetical protein RI909_1388 [Bacteroidota bacterium]